MAIKESLISVMNKLKEVYTHQVDMLTDDDFYNSPSDGKEKLNGMQAENINEEYGQLDSNKYKSGVHAVSSKSEPQLSAREIEHAELEFQEKIKKFCEEHDYSYKRSLMHENFKITDTAGNEIFTVKSSGDFKYTNADETQFKAMMKISAGQFVKNNKTAYPFVKEDDPSIPNSKQEAILRIAIETLLEHEVPLKRIKIRSKKWAHLMDEYALKQKEEFKQVKPVEIGGVEVGESGKPEPNKITKIEPFGTIDKFEPAKAVIVDTVEEKPKVVVTDDEVKNTDELTLKPVVAIDYSKTLQGELFLAMQNSGGAMFKLLQQTESFAKRNFEINFSKNGELGRRCKNSQPSPTLGTLSTFNQPSFP